MNKEYPVLCMHSFYCPTDWGHHWGHHWGQDKIKQKEFKKGAGTCFCKARFKDKALAEALGHRNEKITLPEHLSGIDQLKST